MTLLEPQLMMMMQQAVCRAGPLPKKVVVGYAAPVDRKMFFGIHRMLCSQLRGVAAAGAGQAISQDAKGNPHIIAGMQAGKIKYGFDLCKIEVVAAACEWRSWVQRAAIPLAANAALGDCAPKVTSGPVYHHPNGAIGCIATPISFEWEGNAAFHGVRADRALVRHAYFILDPGGEWAGMGRTKKRTEEAAALNRVNLCRHANILRQRGATFTADQIATIDLYLAAAEPEQLPMESEDEGEDDAEQGTMLSPARAARDE